MSMIIGMIMMLLDYAQLLVRHVDVIRVLTLLALMMSRLRSIQCP